MLFLYCLRMGRQPVHRFQLLLQEGVQTMLLWQPLWQMRVLIYWKSLGEQTLSKLHPLQTLANV